MKLPIVEKVIDNYGKTIYLSKKTLVDNKNRGLFYHEEISKDLLTNYLIYIPNYKEDLQHFFKNDLLTGAYIKYCIINNQKYKNINIKKKYNNKICNNSVLKYIYCDIIGDKEEIKEKSKMKFKEGKVNTYSYVEKFDFSFQNKEGKETIKEIINLSSFYKINLKLWIGCPKTNKKYYLEI